MKLSMYMIEQWFNNYNPVTHIESGLRKIESARLFTDEIDIESDFLYVGRTADFFPDNPSNEIMIIYHKDVMSIINEDLNKIFNLVLSAFDFYNNIEKEMLLDVHKPNPEQRIISSCENLMGPMFILETDYRILACSQNFTGKYINTFWDTFVNNRQPTLEMIFQMKSSNVTKLAGKKQHIKKFTEPNATPYSYGIMDSYCDKAGNLIGQLIIASNQPITAYEMNMAEIISGALSIIHSGNFIPQFIDRPDATEEVLFATILNNIHAEKEKEILQTLNSWNNTEEFFIIVTEISDDVILPFIKSEMQKLFIDGIATILKHQIALLTWGTSEKLLLSIHEKLSRLQNRISLRFGISNNFKNVLCSKYFHMQAEEALKKSQTQIAEFRNIAVNSLLNNSDSLFKWYARHPVVRYLEEYDIIHSTELSKTLELYLAYERSGKQAAKQLYIHRNTVLYRIEQIKELMPLNLDDEIERQYILLSFHIAAP